MSDQEGYVVDIPVSKLIEALNALRAMGALDSLVQQHGSAVVTVDLALVEAAKAHVKQDFAKDLMTDSGHCDPYKRGTGGQTVE